MRAMLLHESGGPVTPAEVEEPRVGPCDAKVRVRAAGVGLTIVIMKGTP
jgi:D-arabinose 1-dehydrogenase-like Zn-dependent alcohol dehydrogenase